VIFGAVRRHFQAAEKSCGVSGAQGWVIFQQPPVLLAGSGRKF
jgi:hypothetical protein